MTDEDELAKRWEQLQRQQPGALLGFYILNTAGEPEPCLDTLTWAQWMETADRVVFQDTVTDADGHQVRVSTVFLGLDHNHARRGPPILWETMVFAQGGAVSAYDDEQYRYRSRAEALAGHQRILERVTRGQDDDDDD